MALLPNSPPWLSSLIGWCLVRKLVCGAAQICHCRAAVNSAAFLEFVKNMRDAIPGKKPKTLLKNLDHAPWKCVMSHLPCRAAVFEDEPNFSHNNPPYLLELNPCNLCLYSRLKIGMKFGRFASLKDIQQKARARPTAIANRSLEFLKPTEVVL